ncbi:hypothetical protein M422DRAFT_34427 [Sphaerobolus stellatus SS14]|uniref:F-box domain-containing protein n=1 Tax=Sphaerobolus stellatus (strain SS14) TaxID=990650 RepID=A0A0C9V361_SPHS4|nr:hypothetical protein M422DRAFT_34427 [Sphaerobolus stellatus SS14]
MFVEYIEARGFDSRSLMNNAPAKANIPKHALPFADADDKDIGINDFQPFIFQHLPLELQYSIFEMLALRKKRKSYDLRLISKDINRIITPLLFCSIRLPWYFWSIWQDIDEDSSRIVRSPLFRMILSNTRTSFYSPWTYITSIFISGEEPWLHSVIRHGYCPNLKILVVTGWLADAMDSDEVQSIEAELPDSHAQALIKPKNILSDVTIFNIVIRERDNVVFANVTHFFLGKFNHYGTKDSFVAYFKTLPSLSHLGIPCDVHLIVRRKYGNSLSVVPFVELILQSLPSLGILMVYLQWSYEPERLYSTVLHEWHGLRQINDRRLIVRDDIRVSDVVRCFYEERSVWHNLWKWEDWRSIDGPPRYRCKGNA